MRRWLWIMILAGSAFASGLFLWDSPILFRSLESTTETGGPVFNRVRFLPGWNRDVWLMQQSHAGVAPAFEKWDRLAIVVDKTRRPFQATFFQYVPGELKQGSAAEAAPFSARCFACHANGPRAIRPNLDSSEAAVGFLQRAQVALWNLRIKTYGRTESVAGQDLPGGAPFRSRHGILAQPLKLRSCTRCHAEDGIRNPLVAEHIGTAHFLVKGGLMPPFPFQASSEDLKVLSSVNGK